MQNKFARTIFAGKTFMAALALAGTTATFGLFNASPASAQTAYDYPWCAYYSGRGSASNCYFSTRGQCMETVRGVGGICQPNAFYHFGGYEPRRAKRARHYHYYHY